MKKKIIIVVLVIAVFLLVLGGMFFIDKNRIDNNKPVIFSTWGYDYAPPEDNPYTNNDEELKFDVEDYVKNTEEYISKSGEIKIFDIDLTEDIYGKEVTEFKQTLEIEEVFGSIMTDEKSFVTIIPMPDFLDNQSYYFQDGKLVAYKKDFMGIGGSVTYYFKDDKIVFIDETKIEEEMVFVSEEENDILERANNVYKKFLIYEYFDISTDEKITEITIEGMKEDVHYTGIKSPMGYTIQYDKDAFSLTREQDKDVYRSNIEDISDEVYFTVEYLEKSFDEFKKENLNGNLEDIEINACRAFSTTFIDGILASENQDVKWDSDVKTLWYIDSGKGTYLIEEHYFFEATEGWGVRINQMINTFNVIEK